MIELGSRLGQNGARLLGGLESSLKHVDLEEWLGFLRLLKANEGVLVSSSFIRRYSEAAKEVIEKKEAEKKRIELAKEEEMKREAETAAMEAARLPK